MTTAIEEKFKELQTKSQKIAEGAIKVNAQIETAQTNYQKIQEIAKAKFETTDLEELKALKENWNSENLKRYNDAENKVNRAEANLNETNRLIKEIQAGQQ